MAGVSADAIKKRIQRGQLRAVKRDGNHWRIPRSEVERVAAAAPTDRAVIRPLSDPVEPHGGMVVLTGNLFDSAVMKTSVVSEDFRLRYLSDPDDPEAFKGRAIVFEGPEDYHHRIEDPSLEI